MTTVTQSHVEKTVARSLMLIGGKAVESADGRYIDIENPATRAVMAQVPRGGEADIDAAGCTAAAAAFVELEARPREGSGADAAAHRRSGRGRDESIARTVALETATRSGRRRVLRSRARRR
jgi:acyl-CoA reductase-like NAD-dependent aldehyde dehydrogenase